MWVSASPGVWGPGPGHACRGLRETWLRVTEGEGSPRNMRVWEEGLDLVSGLCTFSSAGRVLTVVGGCCLTLCALTQWGGLCPFSPGKASLPAASPLGQTL